MATITTTIKEPKTFQAIQEEEQQLGNNKLVENINKNIEKLVEISQNKREVKEDELDKQIKRNNLELSKLQIKKAQYGLAREEKAFSRPSANSNQSSITKSLGMSQSDTTSLGAVALGALTGINPAVLKTMKDTLHIDKVLTAPLKMAVGGLKSLGNMFQSSNRISGKTSTSIDDEPKDERLYDKLEEILSAIKEKSGTNKEEKESKPSKFKDFLKKLLLGALGAVALDKVAEAFSGQIKEAWDKLTNKVQKAIEEHPLLTAGALGAVALPIAKSVSQYIVQHLPKGPKKPPKNPLDNEVKGIKENAKSIEKNTKNINDEQVKARTKAEQDAKAREKASAAKSAKAKENAKLRESKTQKNVKENTKALKENTKAVKENQKSVKAEQNGKSVKQNTKTPEGKGKPNTKAPEQAKPKFANDNVKQTPKKPSPPKTQPAQPAKLRTSKAANALSTLSKGKNLLLKGAGAAGSVAVIYDSALKLNEFKNQGVLATVDKDTESLKEDISTLFDSSKNWKERGAAGLSTLFSVGRNASAIGGAIGDIAGDIAYEASKIDYKKVASNAWDSLTNKVSNFFGGEETITDSEKAEKIEQYAANNQTYLKQTAEQITLLNQNLSKQQTQTPYVDGRTFNQQTIYQGQSFNYTPM